MLLRHYWVCFFQKTFGTRDFRPLRCSAWRHAPIYDQLVRVRKSCPFSPENSCGVSNGNCLKRISLQDLWMEKKHVWGSPTQTGQKPLVFSERCVQKKYVDKMFCLILEDCCCCKVSKILLEDLHFFAFSSAFRFPKVSHHFPTMFTPFSSGSQRAKVW